jgi:hypothetical protein
MIAAVAHQRCRLYGWFTPSAEVPFYLANGWRILDQLADDPIGHLGVLMAPPVAREREAA